VLRHGREGPPQQYAGRGCGGDLEENPKRQRQSPRCEFRQSAATGKCEGQECRAAGGTDRNALAFAQQGRNGVECPTDCCHEAEQPDGSRHGWSGLCIKQPGGTGGCRDESDEHRGKSAEQQAVERGCAGAAWGRAGVGYGRHRFQTFMADA
jgi:hypothetical protein